MCAWRCSELQLESRGVANLQKHQVTSIVNLARPVERPALSFVEPSSGDIGLEHPQHGGREAGGLEAGLGAVESWRPPPLPQALGAT